MRACHRSRCCRRPSGCEGAAHAPLPVAMSTLCCNCSDCCCTATSCCSTGRLRRDVLSHTVLVYRWGMGEGSARRIRHALATAWMPQCENHSGNHQCRGACVHWIEAAQLHDAFDVLRTAPAALRHALVGSQTAVSTLLVCMPTSRYAGSVRAVAAARRNMPVSRGNMTRRPPPRDHGGVLRPQRRLVQVPVGPREARGGCRHLPHEHGLQE